MTEHSVVVVVPDVTINQGRQLVNWLRRNYCTRSHEWLKEAASLVVVDFHRRRRNPDVRNPDVVRLNFSEKRCTGEGGDIAKKSLKSLQVVNGRVYCIISHGGWLVGYPNYL